MGSLDLAPSAFLSILSYGVPGPVGLVDAKRCRAVFAGLWMVKDRFAGRLRPEAREFEVMKALKVALDLAAARVGGFAKLKADRLRERAAPDRSMTPIDVLTRVFHGFSWVPVPQQMVNGLESRSTTQPSSDWSNGLR